MDASATAGITVRLHFSCMILYHYICMLCATNAHLEAYNAPIVHPFDAKEAYTSRLRLDQYAEICISVLSSRLILLAGELEVGTGAGY